MSEKENAPTERDVKIERILQANFSEEELVTGELAKVDDLLEEVEREAVDNVARFLKRVDDKMHS